MTTAEPPGTAPARVSGVLARLHRVPLFWRVAATYAGLLLLVFALLVFAPVTVSIPVALTEAVVLLVGLLAVFGLSLALLRSAFRPLARVTATMRAIDPLRPGQRVPIPQAGEPDVAALAHAFNEMLERLEHERRDSARQALRVQEDERRRIARELHDEVGQIFTAIMLQIESCHARAPAGLADELDELRETARTGAVDVRRIAARLRPEALEELGLHSALLALTGGFAEQTGIAVDRGLEPVDELDADEELVVYRIAQEALTNVARHARATSVEVELRRAPGATVLRISDDGQGLGASDGRSASGVKGMRERAMLIGASFELESPRDGGTTVTLLIPTAPS